MFIPAEEPAITVQFTGLLQPRVHVLERTAREAGWALGAAGFDYFAPSFVSGEDTLLVLQRALLHFPAWITTHFPS